MNDTRPLAARGKAAARFGMMGLAGASVHASLANEIGLRIVRGDYPPGTILPNEAKWAEIFEVSRSAVREAIKMLMGKSLLSSRSKVGSWVEPRERWNLLDRDVLGWYAMSPDKQKFLNIVQEFRYIIEPEATALAAQRRSDEQMAEISAACHDMGVATALPERTQADTHFHLAILRASGNDLLVPLGALIETALTSLFAYTTRENDDLAYALKLHENIERNIRLRRPEAARKAVRKLLANTDDVIRRVDTTI
jgi:DNA-binding FadR family transcriptional regulator